MEKQENRGFIGETPIYCAFDEIVKIEDLKPNPRNPNTHPKEQIRLLAQIIKKTGWRASITVSTLSGFIVKGHGRLIAAKEAGFKECPVEYQNFKDEQEELSALLADNKIAELAEIDTETLAELFKDVDFDDLELTGYSEDEFNELINDFEDSGVLDDADEPVEVEKDAFTQNGDIWLLGKHKLICGDATNPEVFKKLLNEELANLVITDPPYNVNYEGGTSEKLTIQNDDMADEEFIEFLSKAFKNINDNMKEGAAFYIWHADSERYSFETACRCVDWIVRQCVIWVKNTFVMGRQDYQWKHEPCLYGWKSGAAHYFVDDRTLTTCFEFDKPTRNDIHPTMKPLELFSFQIANSSKTNDIVLDAFGGSGTTLISCEFLSRQARVIELDERYCDAIVKRFKKHFPSGEVKCIRNGQMIDVPFSFNDLSD